MINVQQFERIQQLVQPITAISRWLSPKVFKIFGLGVVSIVWFVFYALQFWTWSYWWLIPMLAAAMPLVILGIWWLLLSDLNDLPEALDDLKEGVIGLKERAAGNKKEIAKAVVRVRSIPQFPKLLTELFSLVQGVDTMRTIVTHVIFLANPISWVLFVVSCVAVWAYGLMAILSAVWWLI